MKHSAKRDALYARLILVLALMSVTILPALSCATDLLNDGSPGSQRDDIFQSTLIDPGNQ